MHRVLSNKSVRVVSPLPVKILATDEDDVIASVLRRTESTLFAVDEIHEFVADYRFQQIMTESPHLFLMTNRDNLPGLSYSVDDVLELVYRHNITEAVPRWSLHDSIYDWGILKSICTEDSKSGFRFILCINSNVTSASGKNKIAQIIWHSEHTLFIVDRLNFGPCIEDVMGSLGRSPTNGLLLIPSFEAMVYQSKFCKGEDLPDIWCTNKEKFYTDLVVDLFKKNGISYAKGGAVNCLIQDCCYRGSKCGLFQRGYKPDLILGSALRRKIAAIGNQTEGSVAEAEEASDKSKNSEDSECTSLFNN